MSIPTPTPAPTRSTPPGAPQAPAWRRVEALDAGATGSPSWPPARPATTPLADRAMGFCLLNNVAVAAAALAGRGERVLDRRLGRPPRQRHPGHLLGRPRGPLRLDPPVAALPGHRARRRGRRARRPGPTVNVPLPAGATGDVVRRAFDEVAAAGRSSASAHLGAGLRRLRRPPGRPARRPGPLERRLRRLARTVASFAPGPGRLVLFLEGGYDLAALRTLGGRHPRDAARRDLPPEPPTSGVRATTRWPRPEPCALHAQLGRRHGSPVVLP